jgi:hypothetical protein
LRITHREIPLVLLHRGDQHFGRQFEELRVESSRQRDRPFDQTRDLVEQRVRRDQRVAALQNAAPLRLTPVPVERLDRSLQAMQLDSPQQQALRARIAPAPAAAVAADKARTT